MQDKQFYIDKLKLKPLIGEDFLAEFYISENGFCSWAFYLLPESCVFPFHKMQSDSSWHYCAGGPLELVVIDTNNKINKYIIGNDLNHHQLIQVTKPNEWFAAKSLKGSNFTVVSHCITPPYNENYDDFGYFDEILKIIPNHPDVAKEFSSYKGVNDKYKLNAQTGYRS